MIDNNQQLITFSKDILYLIGSVLGIIGFIRTLKKRDYCSLNYKTDFGNEVEPYLLCLRADMYNLSVSNSQRAIMVEKFSGKTIPAYDSRKDIPATQIERAAFFPIVKEQDFLLIDNHKLEMEPLVFCYEDKYNNKYKQVFSFDKSEIGNEDRIKKVSRSCYNLTKRRYRFMYIWFPLFTKHI